MDHNEVVGTVVSSHNLADIQNYLVSFNKEIDPSSLPVISDPDGSDSVNDILASVSAAQALQSGTSGANHFNTAFYSEQSLLDTSLGEDSSQNIHSLVSGEDGDDLVAQIKQESVGIDLDDASMAAVQAQLVNLTGSISDLTGSSQELIMTSVNDGLDANEGKVIRIVSLNQGGKFLSLGETSHMQILGEDDLHVGSEGKDLPVTLESFGQQLVLPSSSQDLLDVASSTVSTTSATITSSGTDLLVSDSLSDDTTDQPMEMGHVQSQLISVQNGIQGINAEGLQALGLEGDGGAGVGSVILNAANTLQTVAILPSEGQNGEMNYVLIVTQPDGSNKELNAQGISLDTSSVIGLKEEASELTEEYIEVDGTLKRILKITPKKIYPNLNSDLMCTYCNYTSPKRYLLSRHMKSHSEDRPHKCDTCHRGFKTLASLTNHVNTHTGTRPHKCKECDAAFTTSGELVRHVRYRHTFEKPHKCPECDYASVELSKLKRHMRSHTGERPYQCSTCSYASPDTYKLKRHMRIHTGEKPYVCDICNARFTQSNSLKAHKLIHSGNKPVFQCPYCPTTCGRKTDLKIHTQKLHNSEEPVTCRKCGVNFPDRYNFKLHWKTHEGEKCYKCEKCDYAACSQRHLESHILTHSGEKPFECDECSHAFRQKQLLRRHKNHHHMSDYHAPTPRDKNHDCAACDKSYANKGNLMRHLAQHGDMSEDETTSAASGEGEGGLRTITADHILHGDLMQEWRDGKLGNAPQVVIVHPDGRIEEVTPKLQIPPDRSVDDGLSEEGEEEKGRGKEVCRGHKKAACGISKASQKHIIVTMQEDHDGDEDGNDGDEDGNKEAGTQVELASDMSDDDDNNDEEEDEPEALTSGEQFLNKLTPAASKGAAEGSSSSGVVGKTLAGNAVTLDQATSADLESMIASLPVVATPITFDQPSGSQDQSQIPTIDAPEILAHLDFTTKLIKQEKADSDTDSLAISLLQDTAGSSSGSVIHPLTPSSQLKLTTVRGRQSGQSEVGMVSNAAVGKKGVGTESSSALKSVPKTVTLVVGSGADLREKKTTTRLCELCFRSMKRKEDEEQASPAKRTRRSLAEQAYTYI
ncbi:hypothetical protein ACOMHN_032229 [Nucella lapillus]